MSDSHSKLIPAVRHILVHDVHVQSLCDQA